VAVTFYVGTSRDGVVKGDIDGILDFDEELHDYLRETRHLTQHTCDLLINLDPYGEDIIAKDRLSKLIDICELLKQKYDRQDVLTFADELSKLCELALEKDKKLFSIGD
jgi:hypothetical protein